jgi:hypothetical protein
MGSVGGGIRNIPIIPIILAGPRDRFFRVIQSSAAMYNKYVLRYRVCINDWTVHAYDNHLSCIRSMHVSNNSDESAPHPSFIINISTGQLFVAG